MVCLLGANLIAPIESGNVVRLCDCSAAIRSVEVDDQAILGILVGGGGAAGMLALVVMRFVETLNLTAFLNSALCLAVAFVERAHYPVASVETKATTEQAVDIVATLVATSVAPEELDAVAADLERRRRQRRLGNACQDVVFLTLLDFHSASCGQGRELKTATDFGRSNWS